MVVFHHHPGRLRRCGCRRSDHDGGAPIETVVLSGEPSHVLQPYAVERGYEVIVMGNRSTTSSHLIDHRAARTTVPFLIGAATR